MRQGFFMGVKLKDVTDRDRILGLSSSRNYPLSGKNIYYIGSDDLCDVILRCKGAVSRQHAFLLEKDRDYYVGDVSINGTSLSFAKGLIGHYEPKRLANVLEAKSFKEFFEEQGGGRLEFELHRAEGGEWTRFDFQGIKRAYFFNYFLIDREGNVNEKNVNGLAEDGIIYKLSNKDIIEIYPCFKLEFIDMLFTRLWRKKKT